MKFYFPKDDELNLFSIIQSSTGVVIPLCNFDFENHHLTICFKEVGIMRGINIHITDEITKKQVYNKYFEIDLENMENYFIEKFKLFYETEMIQYLENKIDPNEKYYCLDCYFEENFKEMDFSKKSSVKDTFKGISGIDENEILMNLDKFPLCNKERHRMIYNPITKTQYRLFIDNSLLTIEEQEELGQKIFNFMENELGEFLKNITKTIEEIQNILKNKEKLDVLP
jgi:hypothetical protein